MYTGPNPKEYVTQGHERTKQPNNISHNTTQQHASDTTTTRAICGLSVAVGIGLVVLFVVVRVICVCDCDCVGCGCGCLLFYVVFIVVMDPQWRDLISNYKPDLLWCDGAWEKSSGTNTPHTSNTTTNKTQTNNNNHSQQ